MDLDLDHIDGYAPLLRGYEALPGYTRYRVLEHHPSGRFVAMKAIGPDPLPLRAALWDTQSGRVSYAPPSATLLGWLPGGRQIASLIANGAPQANEETAGGGAAAAWREFCLERRAWPDTDLAPFGVCQLDIVAWWPHSMTFSPHGNLVVIRSGDQDISGWDFVVFDDAGDDTYLDGAGFDMDSYAALVAQPGYSPDGRYAASGYHTTYHEMDLGGIEYDVPVRQGEFEVGAVTIVDVEARRFRHIPLTDAVPAALHEVASRQLTEPVFLDAAHFTLKLPTGATRTFSVESVR